MAVPCGRSHWVAPLPARDVRVTEEDLARIERVLPPVDEDGDPRYTMVLGRVAATEADPGAEFDTDDVRNLVNDVRRLRARLSVAGWPNDVWCGHGHCQGCQLDQMCCGCWLEQCYPGQRARYANGTTHEQPLKRLPSPLTEQN